MFLSYYILSGISITRADNTLIPTAINLRTKNSNPIFLINL